MNSNIRNGIVILAAVAVIGGVGFVAYTLGNKSGAAAGTEQNQQNQWGDNGQGSFDGNMPNGEIPNGGAGMRGGMDFSQFVEDGTIDQATADKMEEYMEEQMQSARENRQDGASGGGTDMFSDMFSGMVSEGILTQEQADKIQESMPQMGQGLPPGGSGGNENTQ